MIPYLKLFKDYIWRSNTFKLYTISKCFCTSYLIITIRLQRNNAEALLSEDARNRRHRTQAINLQMVVIAWSLEFISGLLVMVFWFFVDDKNDQLALILIDILLRFVIIPGSYLLNTEVSKALVVAEGWWKSIRVSFSSNKIQPINNQDVEIKMELRQVSGRPRPTPKPISTISGNLVAFNNSRGTIDFRRELTTVLQEVNRQHLMPDLILYINLASITPA